MTTQHFGLLEEREENELHKARLLNVEEKPFKRITKRLIGPGAFTNPSALKLPTPPPEGDAQDDNTTRTTTTTKNPPPAEITALKEDIILDFAAFDSAIARLQFLTQANAAERERYAADRLRILETMDNVRESNTQLRAQLDQAKAKLAQRKKFDDLADKITGNRMLRTRSEQQVNLQKLAEECEELHRESETYSETWRERREQFGRLVDEGKRLRALIRDEKEEVERREGMDSDAEDGETGEGSGATPGKTGSVSGNATPGPDNGAVSTPRPSSRDGRTPRPDSPGASGREGGGDGLTAPGEDDGGVTPRAMSQTPAPEQPEEGEDVTMEEGTQEQTQTEEHTQAQAEIAGTPAAEELQDAPQITVDAPAGSEDKMDTT